MTDRTQYCAGCKARQDHIEKLEADKALLREALEQIKGYSEVNGMTRQRMKRIARAALQETSHDA